MALRLTAPGCGTGVSDQAIYSACAAATWPAQREAFSGAFRARTRDEWAERFAGTDACVAPVLSLAEAPHHPQAVARGMKAAGRGGSIVNIASILGHRVAGNLSAYTASKAGVLQLTKALALEWAREGIRVNALCPGYIETDINREFFASEPGQQLIRRIPQRRLGKPAELDGALLLLASAAGSYITGSSIEVDGGHLVSSL